MRAGWLFFFLLFSLASSAQESAAPSLDLDALTAQREHNSEECPPGLNGEYCYEVAVGARSVAEVCKSIRLRRADDGWLYSESLTEEENMRIDGALHDDVQAGREVRYVGFCQNGTLDIFINVRDLGWFERSLRTEEAGNRLHYRSRSNIGGRLQTLSDTYEKVP